MNSLIEIPNEVVESVIVGIMENFPEAGYGCALHCVRWKYDKLEFTFIDETQRFDLTREQLLEAFKLMRGGKWPDGCTPLPTGTTEEEWNDWLCQCDATDHHAFAQLACFGEVIYG